MEERFEVIEEVNEEEKKNFFVRVKEGIAAKKEEFEENHPKASRVIKIAVPAAIGAAIAMATKKKLDSLENDDPDMVYIDLDADEESVPVYDLDDTGSSEEKTE